MSNQKNTANINQVTLDRFEGNRAVFLLDKEEFAIPRKLLPKDIREGEAVVISVSTDREETKKREKTAKEILNEILHN